MIELFDVAIGVRDTALLGRVCVSTRRTLSAFLVTARRPRFENTRFLATTPKCMCDSTTTESEEMRRRNVPIVWVDCEMTGLDLSRHTLVEIAVILTDAQLNIIAEGPSIVINQSEDVLKEMDPWCVKTFSSNGLLEKIRASTISLPDAEQQVLSFLRQHVEKGICPLAGNSVHVDRTFLAKYMKQVDEYLHYRIIDVSTVKELAFRWYPHAPTPPKKGAHRALDDIKESIKELAFYRKHLFK